MAEYQISTAAKDGAPLSQEQLKKVEELIEEEEGATNRVGGIMAAAITGFACLVSVYHLYAAYDIVPAHVLRPVHVACVLILAFLLFPMARRYRDQIRWWDVLLAAVSILVILYILSQGADFGDRATSPEKWLGGPAAFPYWSCAWPFIKVADGWPAFNCTGPRPDVEIGVILILLVLEATRRSTGLIMPAVAVVFILYALFGASLPAPWTHKGKDVDELVGHLYMTLEGIFGSTVDVSSSLIILFTIFGAVLQHSGAGKFFIDFSFAAMGGRRNSAGRAVVLSSFLMGGPSGSGVATTVTIGTVAYPLLQKAGYERNAAGGLLAAGGLGAIISPPVLGAAAFLIAEFLKISYFDVILMAAIPTLLYYLAIWVMVELDAAKYGGAGERLVAKGTTWAIAKSHWFHFGSLISIIVFMLLGFTPVLAVFWATMLAIAISVLREDSAIVPRWAAWPVGIAVTFIGAELFVTQLLPHIFSLPKPWLEQFSKRLPFYSESVLLLTFAPVLIVLAQGLLAPRVAEVSKRFVAAMKEGTTGVINVAATCAAAGIIVGVTTKTGLAQRFADIIISYAQGNLLLTAMFAAAIVWIVGLAVPVTASYIMCAVIAAPALIKLGVPDFAAHMFIFYYAVLSEVSPPTALSPFAAAAITGGSPYLTTLQSWKYTMPAFLLPFVFVLDPHGVGLLLKIPKGGSWLDILEITLEAAAGITALGIAMQGRLLRPSTRLETGIFILTGVLFIFPAIIDAILKPLTGLSINSQVPGLSGIGISLGSNVLLGALLLLAGFLMQRSTAGPRPATPA